MCVLVIFCHSLAISSELGLYGSGVRNEDVTTRMLDSEHRKVRQRQFSEVPTVPESFRRDAMCTGVARSVPQPSPANRLFAKFKPCSILLPEGAASWIGCMRQGVKVFSLRRQTQPRVFSWYDELLTESDRHRR